jgi:hypothetical protein
MYLVGIKVSEESPTSICRIVLGSSPRSLARINQNIHCHFPQERNLDIIGRTSYLTAVNAYLEESCEK